MKESGMSADEIAELEVMEERQERLSYNEHEYILNPDEVSNDPEDDYLSSASLDDASMRPEEEFEDLSDLDMPGFGSMTWSQLLDLKKEDLVDIFFANLDEVTKFYSYYSFIKGFSVRIQRKDKSRVGNQEWLCLEMVCSKEGFCVPRPTVIKNKVGEYEKEDNLMRDDANRSKKRSKKEANNRGNKYSRCGCVARIKCMLWRELGYYYVADFVADHNHPLAMPDEVQFLRSHRCVVEEDISQVQALRGLQVHISHAYEYIVRQHGGYEKVGFTLKDLYNALYKKKAKQTGGCDAQAAITWINMKIGNDKDFFVRRTVDAAGRFGNIFWRDSNSFVDYTAFGDVLIMDSTHKTNRYGQPLVVMVGANNHRSTCVFGFALLVNEKEESYVWLIEQFLEGMKGKQPVSVLTDGDEAMRKALVKLCPTATLRLCAWHIGQNMGKTVKDKILLRKIVKFIHYSKSVQDWEREWAELVANHFVENNSWMEGLYNKRERWAEPYLKGKFYGGMCSTQRCETMNAALKKKLKSCHYLSDVLPLLDSILGRFRNRFVKDNFYAKNTTRKFVSVLRGVEDGAWKLFSDDIFLMIRRQIGFEARYLVREVVHFPGSVETIFYVHHCDRDVGAWSVLFIELVTDASTENVGGKYVCSCEQFESDGIPCPHLFCVMKYQNVKEYPSSLICNRWTKATGLLLQAGSSEDSMDRLVQVTRYSSIMAMFKTACHNFSLSSEGFSTGMENVGKLVALSAPYAQSKRKRDFHVPATAETSVLDPAYVKSKGVARNAAEGNATQDNVDTQEKTVIQCGLCKNYGHSRVTCPKSGRSDNVNIDSQGSIPSQTQSRNKRGSQLFAGNGVGQFSVPVQGGDNCGNNLKEEEEGFNLSQQTSSTGFAPNNVQVESNCNKITEEEHPDIRHLDEVESPKIIDQAWYESWVPEP